jgi:hypothetical protein
MPLCDALALKPPYTEIRSLRSTVSGASIPMPRLDGNDRPGETGKFGSADRDRNVASAEVRRIAEPDRERIRGYDGIDSPEVKIDVWQGRSRLCLTVIKAVALGPIREADPSERAEQHEMQASPQSSLRMRNAKPDSVTP